MVREFTTEFGGKKMAELSSILLMLFPILLSSCTGDEIEKEVNFQKDHEDLNEAHSSKVEEEAQARADTVEENGEYVVIRPRLCMYISTLILSTMVFHSGKPVYSSLP